MSKCNLVWCFALAGLGAQTGSVTTHSIALAPFHSVVLTNTHSRIYTGSTRLPVPGAGVPDQCELTKRTRGVIWKITLGGEAVSAKDIVVSDETGRRFPHVCWSSSGSTWEIDAAGNRTGGGPRTEFLAAGPENPLSLTFRYGPASATLTLEK